MNALGLDAFALLQLREARLQQKPTEQQQSASGSSQLAQRRRRRLRNASPRTDRLTD